MLLATSWKTFECDDLFKEEFDSVKRYLLGPLVLGEPVPDKPIFLYIAV